MSFTPLADELNQNPNIGTAKVKVAYELACKAHAGQKRLSGEDYIEHPVAVALIMAKCGGDEDTICAALLHDAIEDSDDPELMTELIRDQFGARVQFLVEAVSKNNTIVDSRLRHQDFIYQLNQAFDTDVGVFFIKWADLIHNLESIELLKPEKKAKWLNELRHDYLPALSDYFHKLSFRYHPIYHQMMDRFEEIVSQKI